MSNFQAIGGVGATLQKLLKDRMELPPKVKPTDFQITISTPRSEKEQEQSPEKPRVNLFLYRVTENGFLKNQEIPGQGHPASYGQPPLSLDLHYLLTAYGTTAESTGNFVNEMRAHYLMGSAMRVLHEYPVITESLKTSSGEPILHESLRDEFEKVKLCLEPISLEDLSKVWTALTLPYRLSAAYRVSVVQIESRRQKRLALPVLDLPRDKAARVHVVAFKRPQITEISPALAYLDDKLTIRGVNLSNVTQVKIGHLSLPVTPASDEEIELTVPWNKYPDGKPIPAKERLQAGPQTVQAFADISTLPGKALSSNLGVFMLAPTLKSVNPKSGKAGDAITVGFIPYVHRGDRAYLFIGDRGLEALPLASGVERSAKLTFELPTGEPIPVRKDMYPLRLRINGAESAYELIGTPPRPKWRFRIKKS